MPVSDTKEPIPEVPFEVSLDLSVATAALSDIRATDFNEFRHAEFAQLAEHDPGLGDFIQNTFGKLIQEAEIGEESAYQGLTGMLAAYRLLTICAGEPLPPRNQDLFVGAVEKTFSAKKFNADGSEDDGAPIDPSIVEIVGLFSNHRARRGAEVILRMFDDVIVRQ